MGLKQVSFVYREVVLISESPLSEVSMKPVISKSFVVHTVLRVPPLFPDGLQSISTNSSRLFKRKFKTSEYFYCKNCKTYEFGAHNESVCQNSCQLPCVNSTTSYCSRVHMDKSVIFVGDPSKASSQSFFNNHTYSVFVNCYITSWKYSYSHN